MAGLNELLGTLTLTAMVQGINGGVPQTGIDPRFFQLTSRIEGDVAMFHRSDAVRKTSRRVGYGGAPRARALIGLEQVRTQAIHSFEMIEHQMTTLQNIMAYESFERQNLGRQEIVRQTEAFRMLFDNLRVSAVMSSLFLGHIYFDEDGDLLHSSSGAVVDVDQRLPSGNTGQLNMLGAGAIIDASWGTASTKIVKHLAQIIAAAAQVSGLIPTTCYYGSNVRDYILSNTQCISLMQSNGTLTTALAQGAIPDGFGGIKKWISGDQYSYVDAGGTRRTWCGADTIALIPDVSKAWYEMQEGTYLVPNDVGRIYNTVEEGLANLRTVQGMFQFAKVEAVPPKLEQYAGDVFLPVFKNPNAVILGDVTP